VLARQRSAVALCAHAYRMDHLKFLQKTEIATRNWLQNQGRTEEKGANERVEEGEK
jgi:hypothetical protein